MNGENRILIVDDSRFARNMARLAVKSAAPAAVIVEADCAEDALERVVGDNFTAAIIDLNMPGVDGLELSLELRRRFANIRLALCTANIQKSTQQRAEGQNILFIAKPIDASKVGAFLQD